MINAQEAHRTTNIALAIKQCKKQFEQDILLKIDAGQDYIKIHKCIMPPFGVEAFEKLGYTIKEKKEKVHTDEFTGLVHYDVVAYEVYWK